MSARDEGPLAEAMLAWLESERVVLPSGAVQSWNNPSHPGYTYPEAAGLLLGTLAFEAPGSALGERIGAEIDREAARGSGGVGRDGARYAFDTAVVLAGVLLHHAAGGGLPSSDLPSRLFSFVAARLEARAPVEGVTGATPDHWSVVYGAHLLKAVIALDLYASHASDPRADRLVEQLLADLLPLAREGRFVTHEGAKVTYLHGSCYAVEGLLWLRARGRGGLDAPVRAAADWLARVQAQENGLPAWHDGASAWGEHRADVAAQALRIWAAVDRRAYEGPIQEALRFLAALQTVEGGVRYHLSSGDVNTWCTVFALQASRWAARGAEVTRLV